MKSGRFHVKNSREYPESPVITESVRGGFGSPVKCQQCDSSDLLEIKNMIYEDDNLMKYDIFCNGCREIVTCCDFR